MLERAGISNGNSGALLGSTQISADPNADILYFTVKDHDRNRAELLANAYAKQYTVLRAELDTQSLRQARSDILKRVAELGGRRELELAVQRLSGHEFLVVRRSRGGDRELYVSRVR